MNENPSAILGVAFLAPLLWVVEHRLGMAHTAFGPTPLFTSPWICFLQNKAHCKLLKHSYFAWANQYFANQFPCTQKYNNSSISLFVVLWVNLWSFSTDWHAQEETFVHWLLIYLHTITYLSLILLDEVAHIGHKIQRQNIPSHSTWNRQLLS